MSHSSRHIVRYLGGTRKTLSSCKFSTTTRHCSVNDGTTVSPKEAPPRVVFSGIQPTGVPHLGNYLGALQPWVKMQNEASSDTTLMFCIVDLHSLTSRTLSAPERRMSKLQMLATFLAIGLNPERSILFNQSDIPYHSELHWILSCDASMGFLSRMRQWQSKLGDDGIAALLQPTANPKSQERMKLGLFTYPVLQAADILLYRATEVPVGEDQVQHIEFARNLATAFNATYGGGGMRGEDGRKQKGRQILVPPQFKVSPAKRIMSLTEPTKKMSKSDELERSRILLTDDEETIRKKVKTAVTDSIDGITYARDTRPGVSNLIELIANLDNTGRSCQEIADEFEGMPATGSIMRVLKERAVEVINSHLHPIRERYAEILNEPHHDQIHTAMEDGAKKAYHLASPTMDEVKEAVGLT